MSKRAGRARWVLPNPVDPPDTICFQIQVPNEKQHIAAFLGAIYDLSKPYNWQNDDAHTAITVGQVWKKIFDALRRDNCTVPSGPASGTDGGDDFMIRQNPDNPCLLESSVDGITWCAWADLTLCLTANPAQPTGGGQPTPGECREYDAVLPANGQWLLPVQVNPGDQITVLEAKGASTDGTTDWFCFNGKNYGLGICGTDSGGQAGDPIPTINHMRLIAKINGLYYDAIDNIIGVPIGTPANQNMTFQVNDPSLSDNGGTLNFKVRICAAGAGAIGITYDYGFGPSSAQVGDTIVITSNHNVPNNAQVCTFHLSQCCTISVLGGSGFVPVSGGTGWWDYDDCASVLHNSPAPTSTTVLTDFPAHTDLLRLEIAGDVSSVFTLTVKIEA